MRKFETKTASWSRHRRQTLLMRLVSLTLCFALFVSSTGMALIGEGEQQDASADATVTNVVPNGDTGDGADAGSGDAGAGGDALPGDTGDGSDVGTGDGSDDGSSTGEIPGGGTGENPGGDAGENPGGEPVDPGAGENPPVDNTAEIAAALERFNAALDAFRADYTYELSNHGIDGHVCRWTQFEMALNLATAVKTSVSELIANDAAVLSGLDETNAMLSVCAAGAYESRATAVLARTDYTGMTQFDADVARVDSLLKHMLDAELNSGVITGLRADLTQMRVDLAAALESGSGSGDTGSGDTGSETPENPDQLEQPVNPDDAVITEIAAAYEALNAGWQSMSFDVALAEIGRIQAMIGGLTDAGKADINIVAISEYLVTIQSAAAVQELGARVAALQAEDLAAPGLADRINDAKALVSYMTATDAASDAVTGRLAALDAILEALNAPAVSDMGKKFVADVAALKGIFDSARLHAMSKQVAALRDAYELLVETDKADASVIAALAELDALQSACDGLDGGVKAFLVACDALFEAYAQPGFDIESESAQALARSVADAFAVLDESSFDNVEVVEYYTRLEAAGLLPKDDIAAQIDFQVKMDRLENTSAVEAYSAGMGNKIQVFKLEHNSSANMGAGDVEYSDDYFRSYAILGLDAQDVSGTALGLDFSITAAGETDRVNGNYIQQVYASTKSYDEIDALVNQIAQTDFATATYTMEDLLAEHFVEIIGDAAAPAGTQCYIVAYDVDAQGANVSAYCDISVCIGGGDWMAAAPGTSVGYKFRGVTEPGNRVADPEDVDGIGTWQYSRVGGVEGDGVFVDDAVLNNGTVRLVARELRGILSDENGVGMGDIALALFTYDAGTDAYTRLERDISGNRLADVLSTGDGSYLFDKLPAGDYYIAMRGAGLNNKAAGAGMIKVTDRMHGLDGWTFVSEGAVSFKTLQQFNTDILLGSGEYVDSKTWDGVFEAGLPPYEIFVTWMDGQPGATLSEDKTHADWVIDSDTACLSFAKSFQVELVVNDDLLAGTTLLYIPSVLCRYDVDLSKFGVASFDSSLLDDHVFRYSSYFDERYAETVLSSVDGLSLTRRGESIVLSTNDVISSGTRIFLPFRAYWEARDTRLSTNASSYSQGIGVPIDSPDDLLYSFETGFGGLCELTFSRFAQIYALSVSEVTSGSSAKNVRPSGNHGARVPSWNPLLKSMYGVSKELFDATVTDNKVVLEFFYRTNVSSSAVGFLDYTFTPQNNGQILAVAENVSNYVHTSNVFACMYSTEKSHGVSFSGDISSPYPHMPCQYYYDTSFFSSCLDLMRPGPTGYRRLLSGSSSFVNAGFYPVVSCLVVYNVDDILDVESGVVSAGCDVLVSWRSPTDTTALSASASSILMAPYTQVISDGSQYSLRFLDDAACKFNAVSENFANLLLGKRIHCISHSEAVCRPREMSDGSFYSDNISMQIDAFGAFSYDGKAMYSFLPGDYAISYCSLSVLTGTPYYSDSGELISWDTDDSHGDDIIDVYVCCADSPTTWVYDSSVHIRDVFGSKKNLVFSHDDILRIRFDYNDCDVAVKILANVTFDIYPNGSTVKSLLTEFLGYSYNNTVQMRCGASASLCARDSSGNALLQRDPSAIQGAWASDLNQLSCELYGDIGYNNLIYPLRIVGYGHTCSHLGQYGTLYDVTFSSDDTSAVIDIGSELYPILTGTGGALEWDFDSWENFDLFDLHTAEFVVLLRDSVDVLGISAGFSDELTSTVNRNGKIYMNILSAFNGGSTSVYPTVAYSGVPTISYCVDDSISVDGFVAYRVTSEFVFDRRAFLEAHSSDGLPFGHFHINVCPKYTEKFLTDDTEVYVLNYIVDTRDSMSGSYSNRLLWEMYRDDGAFYFNGKYANQLSDLDKNGNADEYCIGRAHWSVEKNNPAAYVSGLQLKAQGSSSRLFNTVTTTSPTDPYRYKMTYQQAIEPSTNVVMYNSIEDISGNTWGGTLTQIDMSDADRQNIAYTIYGNKSRIDSLNYVQSKFNHENLRALEDGWFVIDNNTDLSTVKSIAIDFGSHEFQRDENNKPATVSVAYSMTPPSNGFAAGQTSIGNRAFFSDTLKGSGTTRTVMANQVTVTMDTEVGGGISKTIAPLIRQGADSGIVGDGTLTSVAESGTASQAGDVWVDTYDEAGNKITLDKTGKPADAYQYQYHLKYTMDDPGAGSYNSVHNVILYDNLENGTDSKYAGRLTDISVTGVDAFFVELGQGHVPPGGGLGNGELVGGEGDDMEFLAMPFSLLPDNSGVSYTGLAGADVYVNYDGMSVSTNLPDGLVDATGIQDWTLLGSLSDGNVLSAPEGANIRHVAVVVPELTTMHESGLNSVPYQESYIDVALTMEHAGRTDCFGNDKIIRNGMQVSYLVPGVDDPVVVGLPSEQEPELEVIYRDAGFALPVTGGSGWFIPTVSGIGCIVLAASWIMSERKWRRRMAAVMAQQASSGGDNQ